MRSIDYAVGAFALLAAVSTAAAVCHKNKYNCFYAGGSFCQGAVTSCTQGYGDVPGAGFTCLQEEVQKGKCYVYSGCTAGSCTPPGSGSTFTGCESGGTPNQCCHCTTHLYTYDSGDDYKFCTSSETCTANP